MHVDPASRSEADATTLAAIRVLVVADVRLYREGLEQVLARDPRLHVVGGVARSTGLVRQVAAAAADVVVLDMSGPNALATATGLLAELSDLRILGLAVAETDNDAVICLEAGLAGYVPHAASIDQLCAAIRSVAHGELLCSPGVAGTLRRHLASLSVGRAADGGARMLTSREQQIVRLLARGMSNKEIARELIIEVATVKNHVHNILEKLNVRRRSDAVARLHDLRLGSTSTDFARGI